MVDDIIKEVLSLEEGSHIPQEFFEEELSDDFLFLLYPFGFPLLSRICKI
jgi:hypothetical protein